jgi:hypothetical protein
MAVFYVFTLKKFKIEFNFNLNNSKRFKFKK